MTTIGYLSVDYTPRVDVLPHREDRIAAENIEKIAGRPRRRTCGDCRQYRTTLRGERRIGDGYGDDPESEWA